MLKTFSTLKKFDAKQSFGAKTNFGTNFFLMLKRTENGAVKFVGTFWVTVG